MSCETPDPAQLWGTRAFRRAYRGDIAGRIAGRRHRTCRVASALMQTLEQIAYNAGRSALADQESLVAGIQQRTGTLLAAHALVASFLGATTLRAHGLTPFGWVALVALGLGLIVAALLLSPWRLRFAVDTRKLYDGLYAQAATEVRVGTLAWLAEAGFVHQSLHEENAPRVRYMSRLSGALAVLMVCQTLAWLAALLVG